jgi:peptidoglycan/LPS O-acetylase OafA/YrhL
MVNLVSPKRARHFGTRQAAVVSLAGSRNIPSLTGVRGVAAAWVFLTHFQLVMAAYLEAPGINAKTFMYNSLSNGYRGVDLFFVLSGFILMYVHRADFQQLSTVAMHDFYLMRFFRVYPLNTVILVALLPIGLAMPDVVQWFRFDHGVPIPYQDNYFSAPGFVQSLFLA